jgi:choline dehydrogenase
MSDRDDVTGAEPTDSTPELGRRELLGKLAAGSAAAVASSALPALGKVQQSGGDQFDYIVVGSGAGGGPVACNLAKNGFSVLLLEAGGQGVTKNYTTPVFHPQSTEDKAMSWAFFVDHYSDAGRQQRDSKLVRGKGVFYPRAGTLGGCTAHNAMITLYGDNSDWDNLVSLTGDQAWNASNMRKYWQKVEMERFSGKTLAQDPTRLEGVKGWLATEQTSPLMLLKSAKLLAMAVAAAQDIGLGKEVVHKILDQAGNVYLDPNEAAYVANKKDGIFNIPKATFKGRRNGTREHILRTMKKYKNLVLRMNSLCTQVLFAEGGTKAIGIEYLQGQHLYRADPSSSAGAASSAVKKTAMAKHEVILCGGAFNTPQLLMLSGIGPKADLGKFGIPVRVDLPGVGRNLQDRYEVGVTVRFKEPIDLLKKCTFGVGKDPCHDDWIKDTEHTLYGTNGVVIAAIRKSASNKPNPDLVVFGLPGKFNGYKPGYSQTVAQKDCFTWAVLKGHNKNTAGYVTLRSKDPLDTPYINFKYFEEGNDAAQEDLDAVMHGLKMARSMNSKLEVKVFVKGEEVPGPNYQTDDQLKQFIKNEAWGHHASCSNKMGPRSDPMAVVDSKGRVHGTQGLRIVDASIFPRIPGLFIVVPIYQAAEKLSDDILADARAGASAATAK